MHIGLVKRLVAIAVAIAMMGAVAARHAPTAQSPDAAAQPAGAAVRPVPPGTRLADDPRTKGETYYWFEGQTVRSTLKIGDRVVVAERRGGDGKLHAKVVDRSGNDHGDLVASSTLMQFRSQTGDLMQAHNDSGEPGTLQWAARQAYSLSRDGAADLVWDQGVMHSRRAARHDIDEETDEAETVWADGLVASLVKRDLPPYELTPGRVVKGRAWVTTLTSNGVTVGHSVWFEHDHVFAYELPGLTEGLTWIGPEHLKESYGGWPFKPDIFWLNLQTIATHHFKKLVTKQGFVASTCEPPRQNRLAQFFFPTVQANEPGCDGLHYLDGGFFRGCCDDHDRCFSKNDCTDKSWWKFWTSWSCDFCNMTVIACFVGGINRDPCVARSWWSC
jgi:hypothetical protein